jgi:hypothetical protein
MPSGEIVKAAEAGGESCFEVVGLAVEDTTAGSEAVGLAAGDTSTGAEATGVGEEAGVSEVEGLGERLQPTSTISKAARKHRDFICPPLLLEKNPEAIMPIGRDDAGEVWSVALIGDLLAIAIRPEPLSVVTQLSRHLLISLAVQLEHQQQRG